MIRPLLALALLSCGLPAQNLVVNGDFERHSLPVGCNFNLSNPEFSAVAGCTAFGSAGEIDVLSSPACGSGALPAPSGATRIAIHSQYPVAFLVDAFSFKLSGPVVAGGTYRLSFLAHAVLSSSTPDTGEVTVGLSTSPTDFGAWIGNFTPSPVGWRWHWKDFVAPIDAAYLTVHEGAFFSSWTHLDDFRLHLLSGATADAPPPDLPLAPADRDPPRSSPLPDPEATALPGLFRRRHPLLRMRG